MQIVYKEANDWNISFLKNICKFGVHNNIVLKIGDQSAQYAKTSGSASNKVRKS